MAIMALFLISVMLVLKIVKKPVYADWGWLSEGDINYHAIFLLIPADFWLCGGRIRGFMAWVWHGVALHLTVVVEFIAELGMFSSSILS